MNMEPSFDNDTALTLLNRIAARHQVQLNLVRVTGRRNASVLQSTQNTSADNLFSTRISLNEKWGVFIHANHPVSPADKDIIKQDLMILNKIISF